VAMAQFTAARAGVSHLCDFQPMDQAALTFPDAAFDVVTNHESWWDIPALGWAQPRSIRYMAKRELYGYPPLAWLMRWGGAFPVSRGEPDRNALRIVHETVEAGGTVGIFIQGHREAELEGAKAGAGLAMV